MIYALIPLLLVACGSADAEPIADMLYAASPLRVAAPTFSPAGGTYTATQSVTIRTSSTGSAIYCTTDGSRPRRSASLRYSSPLAVSASQTVRCIAASLDGRDSSRISSAAYVINAAEPPPPLAGWAATCSGATGDPAYVEPTRTLVNNIPTVIYACDCAATALGNPTGVDANCVPGNDSNTGAANSKATPLRSWAAVQAAWPNLRAGDTIALCKGGAWDANTDVGQNGWQNKNCRPGTPCTIRDYTPTWASGDEGRPIIARTITAPLFTFYGAKTDANYQVSGGYRILNLKTYMAFSRYSSASSAYAIRGIERMNDVEICGMEIDGYSEAAEIGGFASNESCSTYNWKIRGNRITNICFWAFGIAASNSEFSDNYLDNVGHNQCSGAYNIASGGAAPHTTYVSGGNLSTGGCLVENLTFRGNELHHPSMWQGGLDTVQQWVDGTGWVHVSGTWYAQPYPQGSALSIGVQNARNILWENNLIDWTPCHPTREGATFVGGNDTVAGATATGITLRGNRITHCRGRAMTFASSQALVENNLITVLQPIEGSGLILAPQGNGGLMPTSVAVRNNTVYATAGGTAAAIWVTGYNAAAGNVVTGNSITYAGPTGAACFRVTNPSLVSMMDNNQCSGASAFATVDGFTNYALAAWRSYIAGLNLGRQFDANSITPPVAGLFVNAPADLTPAVGSPLIGAASTATCTVQGSSQPCSSGVAIDSPTWSSTATAKTRDGAPDIGAMER